MASLCLSAVFLSYNKQYQALPEPIKILTVPVIAELIYLSLNLVK